MIRIDRAAPAFSHLPVEARVVLRLCDGTRSVRALRAHAGMPVALFDRVLHRLIALELISAEPHGAVGVARADRSERLGAWMRLPEEAPRALDFEIEIDDVPERTPWTTKTIATEPVFSHEEEDFFSRSIDHLLEPEERVTVTDPA